jgi:hypothetical protein
MHRCLLLDRCWACGAAVRPAAERRAVVSPRCAACDVELRRARTVRVIRRVVDLQTRLASLLSFIVNRGATLGELADMVDRIAALGLPYESAWARRRRQPLRRLPVEQRFELLFGGLTETKLVRHLVPRTALRPQDRYHRAILLGGDLEDVDLDGDGSIWNGDDSWEDDYTLKIAGLMRRGGRPGEPQAGPTAGQFRRCRRGGTTTGR